MNDNQQWLLTQQFYHSADAPLSDTIELQNSIMNSSNNDAKLQRATAKLIRLVRQAVQQASPSEALAIWKLVKTQEIRRQAPNLEANQLDAMLVMLAKDSGADIVEATLTVETNSPPSLPTLDTQEPALASSINRKGK